MKWRKLGLIYNACDETEFKVTGGRAPVPLHLQNDVYRIYYGSYDNQGRGRVFSLEMNLSNLNNIILNNIGEYPHIDIGNIGLYDDNGIIPSCLLVNDGIIYLYTIGFSIKNKVFFDASSGLAISYDNGITFKKYEGPVIDRTINDPSFAASPFVLKDINVYKMWYVSCFKWETINNSHKHYYNIRYKESNDLVEWPVKSTIAIDYKNNHEYAIARPTVIKNGGIYKMWYCFREQENVKTYRIGYAESNDGISWSRKDEMMSDFDVSNDGWDSEMICYPYVFEHKGRYFMLYNGNGYGKTGFGLAILEED